MTLFQMRDVCEAMDHAAKGEQALHLHPFTMGHPLFARYSEAGHLFDQDLARLKSTAANLGVRVIKVEHVGTRRQHVDLCGKPLERAKQLCGVQEDQQLTLL